MADEPMLDLIRAVLEEQDWHIDRPDAEATVLRAPLTNDDGSRVLWVRTAEEQYMVTAYASYEVEVPGDRIAPMLELAARLNAKVAVGGFEVDPDSGDTSFKNGIDVEGNGLTIPLIRQLLGHVLVASEKAFPLVLAVAEARFEPRQAVGYF